MTAPEQHPAWCLRPPVCDAAEGGAHHGRVRLVPQQSPADRGRLLQVDLYQPAGGDPQIRVTDDNLRVLSLSLASARLLGYILRDLSYIGRRAES